VINFYKLMVLFAEKIENNENSRKFFEGEHSFKK
jgi:hypothetical protein